MRARYFVLATLAGLACLAFLQSPVVAQTDLDAFMRQVLAKRDDNWKKLQQYILDEREEIEVRGPGQIPFWGERRDYTWYIRDGFFVRSPVKVNGVQISESERRKAESEYLRRVQERDKRAGRGQAAEVTTGDAPRDLDGLIRQSREPQFISSAYFLRFKFEQGKYALVGHETTDGRDTLRIEYYPARLFSGTDRRHSADGPTTADRARDAEFQRLMNKVSLVTIWVEPKTQQIVKYTFNNVDMDFLPAQWLVQVNDVKASMTMGQPFPDVWLPNGMQVSLALTLAIGEFDVHYGLDYHDYRRPDVTSKVGVK